MVCCHFFTRTSHLLLCFAAGCLFSSIFDYFLLVHSLFFLLYLTALPFFLLHLVANYFVSQGDSFMEKENKSICWRPKNALIECIVSTKCFEEKQSVEDCVAASECFMERRNWTLCKVNAVNPRYRLRGNPYDVATEDQKKIEARNERIKRRELEEEGIVS
ncbi:hypothetical protein, conserved [Trypanosoma brucei brucei TREU927]|uniref:Uncharacterized protein n=3 Tax=Trypanozoon TaxID=39700 RepID=Q580B1_TRYB2|nr:hypothetical protein, conserved [Trypanosoma brucei brucei TREU927]AAX80936.1 hypothetical protein, conserved [Trypanosoma brucei]AAZ10674.1 hypothetical protein, conserved [Trypanosoma brucei brucei TREU927]